MKIKKKDLRKGEAQLPINYPAPDLDDVLSFSFEEEKSRVENLCRRLAHNEEPVREAVLVELPRYVQEVTQRAVDVEQRIGLAALRLFTQMQRRKEQLRRQKKFKVNVSARKKENATNVDGEDEEEINVLRALDIYRDHASNADREQRRQAAIQQLQQSLRHETDREHNGAFLAQSEEFHEEARAGEGHATSATAKTIGGGGLRQQYRAWVSAWADVELLLLKLSRGLYFCLWHSDKPLVQLDCARRIAQLITAPQNASGKVLFLSCLLRIVAREWRTIDRYRSDKFLAFVRRLVYECASLIKSAEAQTVQFLQDKSKECAAGDKKKTKGTRKRGSVAIRKESEAAEDVTRCEPLRRVLDEACYIFRAQLVPDPIAVGLSMHIADVFFDELCRAKVSPRLFIALSDRVALFAMSRGNFIEKRVLDHFIAPMAGGLLADRRRHGSAANGETDANENTNSDLSAEESAAEANEILLALAERCRRYAVGRRTVRAVRVMFTESELALRQAADPTAYEIVSRRAERRRLESEIKEVEETRHAVVAERRNVRLLRKQDQKKTLGKVRGAKDQGTKTKIARKAKAAPRDTKRKKHYKLTKKDLYSEED